MSAFDYLTRAHGFIHSASDLIETRQNSPMFRAPILHLLAHGAELLFKGVHLWHGATHDELKNKYRHDIWKCWSELPAGAEDFRQYVLSEANDTWARASEIGMVPRESEYPDGVAHFLAMLEELSKLHTSETEFALRYPQADQTGMVPLHLRDTLAPAVQWAVASMKNKVV